MRGTEGASRGVAGPHAAQLGLTDLPDLALLCILSWLPCDDHARAAALSRRFAALVASPEALKRKRLTLACSALPRLPDAVRARLIKNAVGLRELDISQPHPERQGFHDSILDTVDLLSAAQRQQLTLLRCDRTHDEFLSARQALETLQRLPNLRCLDTSVDVSVGMSEPEDDVLERLMAALPRSRIRRLRVYDWRRLQETDDAVAGLSAQFVRLFDRSADVVFATRRGNLGAWRAFEQAVKTLDERGSTTTFTALAEDLEGDRAALLAAQPRMRGLAVSFRQPATLARLLDALAAPSCSVRNLTISNAVFPSLLNDENDPCVKLQGMLRSGSLPLERLVLRSCWFEGVQVPGEPRSGFSQLCASLADASGRLSGGRC